MMRLFDDIFDKRYLFELTHKLNYTPWYPNNIANRDTWPYSEHGSHKLLGETFFLRKNLNIIEYSDVNRSLSYELIECFYAIAKRAQRELVLQGIYANLQFCGMDGTNHTDSFGDGKNVYNYIMMLGDDVNENEGGEFVNESTQEIVPYSFGRVIEIDAYEVHRGLSFTTPNKCRYSIKFVGIENIINDGWVKFW